MKAKPVHTEKRLYDDGGILQIRIWLVPVRVVGSAHFYKYSLFYVRSGIRLVGYDNERGKGDRKHVNGFEIPYRFVGIAQLLADFRTDVLAVRGAI